MIFSSVDPKKYFLVKVIPLILLLIWLAAIFSSFLLPLSKSFSLLSILFMKMFASVCHQDHDKSFILGKHIYVCARCAGIYLGCFVSALVLLFGSKIKFNNLKILFVTSTLLMTDVFLVNLGLYEYSHTIAFITGFLFGTVVYIFLISSFEDFVLKKINHT
jgi:uncharacterized membrane protein